MFALVDCNNFFASCEEVFNPKLSQKPLIILSNNDGCIIARSRKAKDAGIKMGEPAYLYKGRKDLVILSSNFPLYSDMSARVMETLSSCTPDLEIYSIDEAFMLLDEDPARIRERVKKWTGIPVSIGIGPTKTLAKLASEIAKKRPHGFYYYEEHILSKTKLQEIWGIGSNLALRLQRIGIHTAEQLANAPDHKIQQHLGVNGLKTTLELRGIPAFPIQESPEKKQSIVCSRSFGHKVDSLPLLEEAVAYFAARAAEKLRDQQSLSSFLSVFISINHSETFSSHVTIPTPTSHTPDLIHLAKQNLRKIFRGGVLYRKAGVLLGDFCDVGSQSLDLFAPPPTPKKEAAMRLLDSINDRFDKSLIQFAAEGIEKTWKSNRSNVSPKYTTSWLDLIKVK